MSDVPPKPKQDGSGLNPGSYIQLCKRAASKGLSPNDFMVSTLTRSADAQLNDAEARKRRLAFRVVDSETQD